MKKTKVLVLVVVFFLWAAAASPTHGVPHQQFLQGGSFSVQSSELRGTCAPLCWEEYDQTIDLHVYYRLDGCHQFNVTRQSKRNPMFDGWSLQLVESMGSQGYLYRNSWTDFSLGDDTFAFQSWRNRWTWTPDASSIVHTTIYQSAAQPAAKMEVFDTVTFTSTVYRLHNDTFVVRETTVTAQKVPYAGPVKQDTTHTTSFFPRLHQGCNSGQ
jgi:hypothetical protein